MKIDLTPRQLELVAAAVRYVLELDPDGDGYPPNSPEARVLAAALAKLDGVVG